MLQLKTVKRKRPGVKDNGNQRRMTDDNASKTPDCAYEPIKAISLIINIWICLPSRILVMIFRRYKTTFVNKYCNKNKKN